MYKMACFCATKNDSPTSKDTTSDSYEIKNTCCVPKAVKVSDEVEFIIKCAYDTMPDEATGDVFEYVSKYLSEGSDRIAIVSTKFFNFQSIHARSELTFFN